MSSICQAKSQGQKHFGSKGEDFLNGFTVNGHVSHLGIVTIHICYQFTPLNLKSLNMDLTLLSPKFVLICFCFLERC